MTALRRWIHERLHLPPGDELALLGACKAVLAQPRQGAKALRRAAGRSLSKDFAEKIVSLRRELSSKDDVLLDITTYFDSVVADLTAQTQHDPKTKLLHFPWFKIELERLLAFEQRLRWCAVGLVDIANFKSYNDILGHAVGDRIIQRVAQILAEQVRSDDLLATASQSAERRRDPDLHARFGGDEFAFLLPDVPSVPEACRIAQRFKTVVERHDWASVHPNLAERLVLVDVGMACLQLGPLAERQHNAGPLAAELIDQADQLMYSAKRARASTVRAIGLRLDDDRLIKTAGWEEHGASGGSGDNSASV
jgi:GGDEF domain-containing protein